MFVLLIFARLAPRAPDKRTARLAVRLGELILAGAITANIVVVGAALGAYRERMAIALMPHGPFELAAYSLAIALYLQDRRRNLPAAYVATVAAACVALLAIAAVAGDVGERMSPGRTLLAVVAVAAGLAVGVPLLSSSLHKLGAQGWFHSGATKGRPDPAGHADPAHHPASPDSYSRQPRAHDASAGEQHDEDQQHAQPELPV